MLEADDVTMRAIPVEQPIGKFFVGVMDSEDLIAISYADVRTMVRDIESFAGIQRPLSTSRVKELQQYVTTVDATFPTSIILAIPEKHARYDPQQGVLRITRDDSVAKIIDGQHRIDGLKGYDGDRPFQLNVTIFVEMEMEDQAMVFATINLKQTKVNKSLAYDLYEYATTPSPQRTCHNIAKLLNGKRDSPFEGKIKILGTASGQPAETITQAAFVDQLAEFLSWDMMDDRDRLKRGKRLLPADTERRKGKYIFRPLLMREEDAIIARILWNYFSAVRTRWPTAWDEKRAGNVLNRTTGFMALMRFLRPAYKSLVGEASPLVSTEDFERVFAGIPLTDNDFSPERFQPGGSGPKELYETMLAGARLEDD